MKTRISHARPSASNVFRKLFLNNNNNCCAKKSVWACYLIETGFCCEVQCVAYNMVDMEHPEAQYGDKVFTASPSLLVLKFVQELLQQEANSHVSQTRREKKLCFPIFESWDAKISEFEEILQGDSFGFDIGPHVSDLKKWKCKGFFGSKGFPCNEKWSTRMQSLFYFFVEKPKNLKD